MELEAERDVARRAEALRVPIVRLSESSGGEGAIDCRVDDATTVVIVKQVADSVATIEQVATKSKNLKGTFQRALKDAVRCIRTAVEVLQSRTSTEETRKLQEDNTRLRKQVMEWRREMAEMREEAYAQRSSATPAERTEGPGVSEETVRTIMQHVGSMMSARFEAMEERLLPEKRMRPPLAADRNIASASTSVEAGPSQPGPSQPGPSQPKPKKRSQKGKKGKTALPTEPEPPRPLPPAPTSMSESWATVTKRGLAPKKVQQQSRSQTGPKLRAPRSVAIVLALQPGAAEKGVTYAKALVDAKAKINLADLGITALRFRTTMAGARALEIPGATNGDKADAFAAKLREVFDPEHIRVTRPTKCAEMRISGLDDSVTSDDVAVAIGRVGGCTADSVRVGVIRCNHAGLGSALVRCPVSVAKKVANSGRLLVGWVAAQVKMLPQKPVQCYRCHGLGHVKEQCGSAVDRSDQCYRCGQAGHKAGVCTAAVAHCTLCAAASRPAGHRIGSNACAPPPKKQRRVFATQQRATPQAQDGVMQTD